MNTVDQSHGPQISAARRDAMASAWTEAVATIGYVPLSPAELRIHLLSLTDQVITCLLAEPFDPGRAREIGATLARLHYREPDVLDRTLEVLGQQLVADAPPERAVTLQPRLARLLGGVAAGFFSQAREAIIAEQEQIRTAVFAELQRVAAALRESEARLAEAQRVAHIGSWYWEAATDSGYWSDEAYRILGLSPQALRASLDDFRAYIHPEDREFVDGVIRAGFGGASPFAFDHRIVRPDGEVRFAHQEGEVIFDEMGRPLRAIGTIQDITERRALEEQRYLQQFVAMVSHDLRQPLTILSGRVQLLIEQLEGRLSQPERRALLTVRDTAGRIQRLVEDLQDSVHIGAKQFQVQRAPMDLVGVLRHIVEQQESTTSSHRLIVEAPERLEGSWDRDRIGQLLTNLIGNAIKYSPEGGEVRVVVRRVDDEAIISVSDEGIGIRDEDQTQLFQPFTRFSRGRQRGKGLGLYISRAIVEAHGGRIWVESEVGEGSTFFVALPVD